MEMDSSLDIDLMSNGIPESLELLKGEDALTIIKDIISPGKYYSQKSITNSTKCGQKAIRIQIYIHFRYVQKLSGGYRQS